MPMNDRQISLLLEALQGTSKDAREAAKETLEPLKRIYFDARADGVDAAIRLLRTVTTVIEDLRKAGDE